MFKNFFNIEKSYWLVVPMILQATIPWFQWRIRIWFVFVFLLIWFVMHVGDVVNVLLKKTSRRALFFIVWYLLFNFISSIYACFGHGETLSVGAVSLTINQVCFFILMHYTISKNKFNELRFLTFVTIFGLCIGGLMAMRGVGIEGLEGARNFVGSQEALGERYEQQSLAVSLGLGDYRYVYMSGWAFALFLMAAHLVRNAQAKTMLLFSALCSIINVRTSGLGTIAGVIFIAFAIYVLWRMSGHRKFVIQVCGTVLVVAIFVFANTPSAFNAFETPIRLIAEQLPEGSIKNRFVFIADSCAGSQDSYAQMRLQLQLRSWEGFCERPLFGWGQYRDWVKTVDVCGGHSLILDHMAYFGIVGMVPLVMMFIAFLSYYKQLASLYYGKNWYALPVMFVTLFIFTSIANPTFGIPHMIYILLPGLGDIILRGNHIVKRRRLVDFDNEQIWMHPF